MPIPADVTEWTYQTVEEIVADHEFEPDVFDFKEALNASNRGHHDEHNASICRTACAMANMGGGHILFGVTDIRRRGQTVVDRIVGIRAGGEHKRDFGNKMSSIQPSIQFVTIPRLIRIPHAPGQGVFVVHIPQSARRPHMYMKNHVFYRRGQGGVAVEMDYYEVREQMVYGEERMRQMTLLRLELRQTLDTCMTLLYRYNGRPFASRRRFDVSAIKPLLANVCSLIPTDDLLHNLMHVVNVAQFMNAYLDEAVRIGYTWEEAAGADRLEGNMELANKTLMSNLPELECRCREAIKTLDGLFGPMTQLPPFPPESE